MASVHHHAGWKKQVKGKHADSTLSKIKKDEKVIQDISSCLNEFKCNPFNHTNPTLQSLQSGIPASEVIATDGG